MLKELGIKPGKSLPIELVEAAEDGALLPDGPEGHGTPR
jgi:hypothetical protein